MIRRAKLMSPLLIIVMLFSLMSGVLTAAVVTTTSETALASPEATLDVTVETYLWNDVEGCTGQIIDFPVYVSSIFCVNATISNTGPDDATGVTADISWTPEKAINLVLGETATKTVGTIANGTEAYVHWFVHCDAPVDATITVTAHAANAADASGSKGVSQYCLFEAEAYAKLRADIVAPGEGATINTCQDFDLLFSITNFGGAAATLVTATVYPSANIQVDDLPPGTSWTTPTIAVLHSGESYGPIAVSMHCNASGTSSIHVIPAGWDSQTDMEIPSANLQSDIVHIEQQLKAHLRVVDVGTYLEANCTNPQDTFSYCQDFWLKFTVENTGDSAAVDVTVTLSGKYYDFGEGCGKSIVSYEPIDIAGHDSATYKVHVHCCAAGTGEITITPAGYDANTNGRADVFLLVDTSGSAGWWVGYVKAMAPDLFTELTDDVDATFGVGNLTDFPFVPWGSGSWDFAYNLVQDMTSDEATFTTAVNGLITGGGGDAIQSQLEALYQAATGVGLDIQGDGWYGEAGDIHYRLNPNFRGLPLKVIILATDDNFHRPGDLPSPNAPCPDGYPGASWDETVAALNAAGIMVLGLHPDPGSASANDLWNIAFATGGWVWNVTTADVGGLISSYIRGQIPDPQPIPDDNIEPGSIWVTQVRKAHLVVDIISPPDGSFVNKCDDFTVTATVTNMGTAVAESVNATISIVGNATVQDPPLTKPTVPHELGWLESGTVSWTLHCDDMGPVVINVTASGIDENTGEPIHANNTEPDEITVIQVIPAELNITLWVEPDVITVCQDFTVFAQVCNIGTQTAYDVWVAIEIFDGAELLEDPLQSLGDLPGLACKSTSWLAHCTGPTDGGITVILGEAWAANADPVDNITFVDQIWPDLLVDIIYPLPGEVFSTCQYFYVDATITNTSNHTIRDVWATIDVVGPAHAVDAETKELGDLLSCSLVDVFWELHCDDQGPVTITVTAGGDGAEYVTPDSVTIEQEPEEPVLVIDIVEPLDGDVFTPCQTFGVKAHIQNVHYWITAYNVVASITIVGEAAVSDEHVGIGDGIETEFYLKYHPIVLDTETIYLNGVPTAAYSFNWYTGEIIFDTAPPDGVVITADYVYGTAALIPDEPQYNPWYGEKQLDDIDPGAEAWVGWTLHCTGPGEVAITVDATAEDWYGNPVGVMSDTVLVDQKLAATLVVDIIEPLDGDDFCTHCAWNEIFVEAIVTNIGAVTARNVAATIYWKGDGVPYALATTTDPYTRFLPDIAAGASEAVSWTLFCTGIGEVLIQVSAIGYDAETAAPTTDSDSVIIYQKGFIVDISVEAIDPDGYAVVSTCQNFEVTAHLFNCMGEDFRDVEVTISWLGGASLLPPPAETVWVDLCDCCGCDVTWTFHCDTPWDVLFVVEAWHDGEFLDLDMAYVEQELKAHLVAGFDTFPGWLSDGSLVTMSTDGFAVGAHFTLVVAVANTGEATAENVTVSITITGPVELSGTTCPYVGDIPGTVTLELGDIPGCESAKCIIELECLAAGTVTIEITDQDLASLQGIDENTQKPVLDENKCIPCPIFVTQQEPPVVHIIQPHTCQDFDVSQDFVVKANVTNPDAVLWFEDVYATVWWSPSYGAGLIPGEVRTKYLYDIAPGGTHEVAWTVHCQAAGELYIWVEAQVMNPYVWATSETVNVHQHGVPDLEVDIVSPVSAYSYIKGEDVFFYTYIATCQEFAVTAWVGSVGTEIAEDVWACIDIYGDGDASLVPGEEWCHYLGDMWPGHWELVTWTLHCDEPGWTTVDVVAYTYYDDVYIQGSDTVEIMQYPKAHLKVDITAPVDGSSFDMCQDFIVRATVSNTGWADAWDVTATLSVEPEGSVRVTMGGYTKYIGTLTGHGAYDMGMPQASATVEWSVHCKVACYSTITVTAAGYDEFGYQFGYEETWYRGNIMANGEFEGMVMGGEFRYDGYLEGNVDLCLDGYWEGFSDGMWTGWIDGWYDGYINGDFTGYYDSTYYDGSYKGCVANDTEGMFVGYQEGYFSGWEDGCFLGYKDGWFVGSITTYDPIWVSGWLEGEIWYEGYLKELTVIIDPGAPIPLDNIDADSITVKQEEVPGPGVLEVVEIVAPEQVYVLSEFEVVVVVANNGGTDATGVTATLTVTGPATITSSPTFPSTIAAGDQVAASWTLRCDGKGGVGISVSVHGTGTNTAVGAATVQQTIDPDTWIVYLASINATLVSIDDTLATIASDVGEMVLTLDDIHATLVYIEDDLAWIETDLGMIQGTLVDIQGELAVINTTLGQIKIEIGSIVIPDQITVHSWYWLIGPILGGFVILGVIVWFAVRKRPPVPPPPPPTPGA